VFQIYVLLVVEGGKEERLAKEQEYLNVLYDKRQNCYNLSPYARSSDGLKHGGRVIIDKNNWGMTGKKHSEETKQKMSAVKVGKKVGLNHPMYGKHHTEEAKQKNSMAHIGENNAMFGKTHSTASNEKRRLSCSRPVEQFTKEGVFIAFFIGAKAAAQATGIQHSAITDCVNGKRKSAGSYLWKRKQ